MDSELTEAIRQILDSTITSERVVRRYMRQVVREGRVELLARVLRSPSRVHRAALAAVLGSPTALSINALHRRTAVGLALGLSDARLLTRFARYFAENYPDDQENLARLRTQQNEEQLYTELLDQPGQEVLARARAHEPDGWFVGLLRRAMSRKSPPELLARLTTVGFEPGQATWRLACLDALAGQGEVRPVVAAWIRAEAGSRGWDDALLEWLVGLAEDRTSTHAQTAARLLAAPAWRADAQERVLDRLAHGRWLLDRPGRELLAELGVPATAIRALEAYAERASRLAREEAAAEMAERFRRESEKRTERMLIPVHRIWAELTLVAETTEPGQRHHFARMLAALEQLMAELGVEPYGAPGEQVPYRLAIHRYIGHDSPPPAEAPVKVVEPGLRQPAESGRFRIVRKALVS